jgi:hypothetical protein
MSDTNVDDENQYIELDRDDDELNEEETDTEKSGKKRSIVHINFNFNKQENLYYCMHCR